MHRAQLPCSPAPRRWLSCGITPSQVSTALRLAAEFSYGRPKSALLTVDAFDAALRLVTPRHENLGECSVVELLLLICIKLADKELPPPHTLKMALREYAVFCASGGPGGAQYDYPKPLLYKSFEHLCALGLVSTEGGGGRARQPSSSCRSALHRPADAPRVHQEPQRAAPASAALRHAMDDVRQGRVGRYTEEMQVGGPTAGPKGERRPRPRPPDER